MKTMKKIRVASEYQYAKKLLREQAAFIKKEYPPDKARQRMLINDYCDCLCKNYAFSEHKCKQLSKYAAKLHSQETYLD